MEAPIMDTSDCLVSNPPSLATLPAAPAFAVAPQPQPSENAPTIASLFTGGGLFEAGAMAAGFRPLWGIEFDPDNPDFSRQIADAYERNFGTHLIRKTVEEVAAAGFEQLERPTALHISQPCKSFSAANAKTEAESDLKAARAVCCALTALQPPIVTLENVTRFRNSQCWQLIRETLTNLGYGLQETVVNAADCGVPQIRKRFIAIAVKGKTPPQLPEKMAPVRGWWEAIADLIPTLRSSQLADWQLQRIQNPAAIVGTHCDRSGEAQSKSKIQNGKAYLIERAGARKERDLLVRAASEPSWTIKANIATDHKGANRHDPLNVLLPDGKVVSLNARAIARLQSVPDWYELPEPIGVAVTLIGNGVPCLLAQRLMEALKPCLEPIENPKSKIQNPYVWLALDEIRRDGGTQPRVKMDLAHIKRLEEQIEEGQQLEPVVVFHDGENYWLADGFHRTQAYSNQEQGTIACVIHQGSRRDAILYSVGANADHKPALPRSREDKRRAVMTLLNDPEWGQWSDREIARRCQVNNATVSRIRASLLQCNSDQTSKSNSEERTYKTKHGTIAKMNVTKIGSSKAERKLDDQSGGASPTQESTALPKPQKLEVNTNDILIAFISNLDCMSEAQVTAAVKAIADLNPDLIRLVLDD